MLKKDENRQEAIKFRQLNILNDLLEKPYTEDELQDKYNIERKTLKNDIRTLKENGYDIPKHNKKNGGYVLSDEQKNNIRLKEAYLDFLNVMSEKLRCSDIQKTILILLLQKSNDYMLLSDLARKYSEYLGIPYKDDKIKNNIYNRVKLTLENETNGLIKTGLVEKNNKKYRITKESPIYLEMTADEIMDILYAMETYGQTYVLRDKLMQIYKRLKFVFEEKMEEDFHNDIITVGNIINRNNRINGLLTTLINKQYDKFALEFQYNTKTVRFKTGVVVYVSEKDKLYLIGETVRELYKIIDVEKIGERISILRDIPNDIYNTTQYQNICDEMFSISVAPLEHVRVEFDNYGSILNKFERLKDERKKASIILSDDMKTGIYEDYIRGISDFAKYLRRYGRSVRIIQPDSLKAEMMNSISRLEQRYMEENLYE